MRQIGKGLLPFAFFGGVDSSLFALSSPFLFGWMGSLFVLRSHHNPP